MVDGVKEVLVRKAMLIYFIKGLRLDLDVERFPAKELQVVLVNCDCRPSERGQLLPH